ncbi:hypothetical protein, partial [Pseudomonas amygdali]
FRVSLSDMAIMLDTVEGAAIVAQANNLLGGLKGASLSFVRLSKIFEVEDSGRMAEIAHFLCGKNVRMLKHIYYYMDDELGMEFIKNDLVKHYIHSGELYHPVTGLLVEEADIEDRIVIEFGVL